MILDDKIRSEVCYEIYHNTTQNARQTQIHTTMYPQDNGCTYLSIHIQTQTYRYIDILTSRDTDRRTYEPARFRGGVRDRDRDRDVDF